jgi:histidine ammonia-lyase
LTLICWLALNIPSPRLLSRVTEQAERDAKARLAGAGLASLALKVKDGVGLVVGHPPAGATAASAFEKAEDALAPMTGVAGIVDRLENHVASDSAAAMKD